MAPADGFSNDSALDADMFTAARMMLSGSKDCNAAEAISLNNKFPDGDIELGHISFMVDTGTVSLKPETVGGASLSVEIAVSLE